jgi:hypothetical protein
VDLADPDHDLDLRGHAPGRDLSLATSTLISEICRSITRVRALRRGKEFARCGRVPSLGLIRRLSLTLVLLAAACGDDDSHANPDASGPDAPGGADGPLAQCPDPAAAWDWPLSQAPVTVTPHASWKHDVAFDDAFLSPYTGSGEPETRWIKFAVLLRDPTKVYFQDSGAYAFHYEFASARLDPFAGMTRDQFDAVSLSTEGQEVVLGAVLFPPIAGIPELGIQLVGADPYHPEMVRRLVELVAAHVTGPEGTRAIYMPTGEQQRCRAAFEGWLEERGILVDDSDRWIPGNACYAPGWALGRLTQVAGADIDAAYLAGALRPSDIVFTDAISAEVPYLAGIVTTVPSTPNSHVAILSRSYRVPFVYLRDEALAARAQALVGHDVVVAASAGISGSCDVRLIDVDGLATAVKDQLRALAEPPPVAYPPKVTAGALVRNVDDLGPGDVATVGGKAAHFGLLRDAIPEASPEARALTIDVWDGFMAQPYTGGGTLGEHIASSLAAFAWPPDFAALDAELARIRLVVESADFPASLRPGIETGLGAFDPAVRLRFRSSTNVEDGETFTGAGLYDSVSGCLADDTDADTVGPSLCDASKPDERGIYRAIKKVYASFYARNAFLERLRRDVDPTEVGMGVLVHHSFPDETELANGVATFSRNYSDRVSIVSQLGAVSVTNPDGSALPEVVDAEIYSFGGPYLTPRASSSLVPLGGHVMTWEDDYRDFALLFARVADRYEAVKGASIFVLDYEFKKVGAGDLVVKQVRPLPLPDTTRDVVPYLIGEPVQLCTAQGESSDVWAIHRLKTSWLLDAEDRWISSLATSFWTNAELDRVDGASIAHLSGRPADLAGASHAVAGATVTDSFTVSGATWRLAAEVTPLVQRNEAPIETPSQFWYTLAAEYEAPVPMIDWSGVGTRTSESVNLSLTCPDLTVVDGTNPFVEVSYDGPGALVVDTSYYWPAPPTGATAGYTAPLVKWGRTTITGLASVPIVLGSMYAQSYRPSHHNFGAEYIFEPRLDPSVSAAIKAELVAADVQLLYVNDNYGGTANMWIQGFDGTLRQIQ